MTAKLEIMLSKGQNHITDHHERVNDFVNSVNVCTYEHLSFKQSFESGFELSMRSSLCLSLQLQEIFRKKNEKKGRKGDAEKSAQLVRKPVTEGEGVFCVRRGTFVDKIQLFS